MNSPELLLWPVLLMLAGCALAAVEVFIPSGGILGFLAALSVVTSIILAFAHHGPEVGLTFTIVAVIAVPVCLSMAFHYWPQTAMGKRFLPAAPTSEEVLPESDELRVLKSLLGKTGRSKTPMLPAGAVTIGDLTIDAITQGMPVDAGQLVKIIEVRANRVVVRPLDEREQREQAATHAPDDLLSQSIEALGLDGLDEPLG